MQMICVNNAIQILESIMSSTRISYFDSLLFWNSSLKKNGKNMQSSLYEAHSSTSACRGAQPDG